MAQRDSRYKRIPASSLATIPVQNGVVIKGEHMAILKEVLSHGVNENKIDLDKLITGKTDVVVAYTKKALDDTLEMTPSPNIGDIGILYQNEDDSDGISVYKVNENRVWEFQFTISIVSMAETLNELRTIVERLDESSVTSVNDYHGDVVLDSDDIDFDKENPGITLKEMLDWDN